MAVKLKLKYLKKKRARMNPHFTTGLFLHSLNPTEKENFSEIFRGHGKGPVAWNELKGLYNSAWILQCFLLLFKFCPLFLVHRKKQFMKLICSFQITVFDQKFLRGRIMVQVIYFGVLTWTEKKMNFVTM